MEFLLNLRQANKLIHKQKKIYPKTLYTYAQCAINFYDSTVEHGLIIKKFELLLKHFRNRWVSIIIFSLHPKKKCLKRSVLPQWRRQWFWPSARNQLFRPSVGSNFKKKKKCSAVAREHAWSMIIKQFFSYMHTAGSTGPESKKLSNHVKSGQKLQCPGAVLGW